MNILRMMRNRRYLQNIMDTLGEATHQTKRPASDLEGIGKERKSHRACFHLEVQFCDRIVSLGCNATGREDVAKKNEGEGPVKKKLSLTTRSFALLFRTPEGKKTIWHQRVFGCPGNVGERQGHTGLLFSDHLSFSR